MTCDKREEGKGEREADKARGRGRKLCLLNNRYLVTIQQELAQQTSTFL